jgi:hypothetical protein
MNQTNLNNNRLPTVANMTQQTVNLLVESSNLSFPATFKRPPQVLSPDAILPKNSGPVPASNTNSGKKLNSRPFLMGIDPGITGAIAIIDISSAVPKFVAVFDIPFYTIEVKGKKRKRIETAELSFLLDSYASEVRVALIEEVGTVGTNADPFSAFVFGFATGIVHGVLVTLQIPIQLVKPAVWKAGLGLSSDKKESITRAKKYFPEASKHLTKVENHGRAEAMLLAWFASKHLRSA